MTAAVICVVISLALLGNLVRSEGRGAPMLPPRRLFCVRASSERLGLGRWRGRPLAAEANHSVLVLGPTQSGKTRTVVVPAIEQWPGPVLVASVKDDVLRATMARRGAMGAVAVIDPARVTSAPRSQWAPLTTPISFGTARDLARDLCAASSDHDSGGDAAFWTAAAARHLAPLLVAASRTGGGFREVLEWVSARDLSAPIDVLLGAEEDRAAAILEDSAWKDDRQYSSIVTTLEVLLDGVLDAEHDGPTVSIETFLSGPNTLYLSSPLRAQQRYRPLLTAVRNAVIDTATVTAARAGGRLRPGLLLVHDEAAHLGGISDLVDLAATGVGQGITMLTVFQDLGQITSHYGPLAMSLVANHRARLVLSGTVEPSTIDVLTRLAGTERRREHHGRGRERTSSMSDRPRLTDARIRSLRRGSAILSYDAERPFVVALPALSRTPSHARGRRLGLPSRRGTDDLGD
jgi:type IV secretion system protein VirD4